MTPPTPNRNPGPGRMLRAVCLMLCVFCLYLGALHPQFAGAQKKKAAAPAPGRLLVVGFMGGRSKADTMVHQEASRI